MLLRAERVLRGLVEKSRYERHDTTRPPDAFDELISATAGPFHVQSSLVDSYIPSAVNPGDPDPSG